MAKICKQCNLKYKNSAVTCVSCGSSLEVIESSFKAKWAVIYSAIALLLILATVLALLWFTGPKAKIRKVMRAYKNDDVSAVVDAYPPFLLNATGLTRAEFEKDQQQVVRNFSNYLFSYSVEDVKKPSTNERNEVMDQLERFADYGYDASRLEDIRLVWVGVRGGGELGYWNDSDMRFVVIKYDGRWYCWPK
jgi:hypothetical protein